MQVSKAKGSSILEAQQKLVVAGDHAKAVCVIRKTEGGMTVIRPQWHYFDNDWWQVDD